MSSTTDSASQDQNLVELEGLRTQLMSHRLYESVRTAENLRLFMREHVFAVWDFMSLLKRLQQVVTCCEVPWMPAADASLARFINEIVLGEECDEDGQGGYASHFDLYLSAMDEIGADRRPIDNFVASLKQGSTIDQALEQASVLNRTREFVRTTMRLAHHGQPHEVAAAFFYGREDVIPDMFSRLVESLPQEGVTVGRLVHYLRRHIELDSTNHGPLAAKLVARLSAEDGQRKQQARSAAEVAIRQRIALWDGLLAALS